MNYQFSNIGLNCTTISWDLLNKCNLNCPYCYARKEYTNTKFQYMDKFKCEKILDIFKNCNIDLVVTLLGGEPTLNSNLNFILDNLYNFSNVKKVKLVTNGVKSLSDLHLNPKLEINFSVHPDQDNFDCIYCNLQLLQGKVKTISHILAPLKYVNNVNYYYSKLKDLTEVRPEFIINNDNDTVKFIITKIPEHKLYSDNFGEYTFREAYNKSFKGCYCNLNHYRIFANGDVYRECLEQKLGNIFKDVISFNNQPEICKKEYCHDDCFLDMKKFKL